MSGVAQKIMSFCTGLWEIGKENVKPWVSKVVERGEQQRQRRSGTITETTEGEETFFDKVGERTRKIIKETRLARREDLAALTNRVAELEESLKSRHADQHHVDR